MYPEQAKILIVEGGDLRVIMSTVNKNTGDMSTALEDIGSAEYYMYQIYNFVYFCKVSEKLVLTRSWNSFKWRNKTLWDISEGRQAGKFFSVLYTAIQQ